MLGRRPELLDIVGGGTQSQMLSQFTTKAVGRQVITRPVEATAMGSPDADDGAGPLRLAGGGTPGDAQFLWTTELRARGAARVGSVELDLPYWESRARWL